MPRYIDADKAKKVMQELENDDVELYGCQIPEIFDADRAVEAIDKVPTADVQEVKHAKWIKEWRDGFVNGKRNYELICPYCNFSYFDNQCGFIVPEHFNFCPNCGAKMDGDKNAN